MISVGQLIEMLQKEDKEAIVLVYDGLEESSAMVERIDHEKMSDKVPNNEQYGTKADHVFLLYRDELMNKKTITLACNMAGRKHLM